MPVFRGASDTHGPLRIPRIDHRDGSPACIRTSTRLMSQKGLGTIAQNSDGYRGGSSDGTAASTRSMLSRSSREMSHSSDGSARGCSMRPMTAHCSPEPTTTCAAPAEATRCVSLPGLSSSMPQCACLTTATRSPEPMRFGNRASMSVVLPLPLVPTTARSGRAHRTAGRVRASGAMSSPASALRGLSKGQGWEDGQSLANRLGVWADRARRWPCEGRCKDPRGQPPRVAGLAEACRNRTYRTSLSDVQRGFEDRPGHQPRDAPTKS